MTREEELALGLKLLRGKTVQFERLTIKPLTLGEIEELGIVKYFTTINFATLTKDKVLGRKHINSFKNIPFFQIVVNIDELREAFLELVRTFVSHDDDEDAVRYVPTIDTIVVRYNKINGKINKTNFEQFLEFMRFVYHVVIVQRESERTDIDEEMAELLREFEEVEDKISKSKGTEITFLSMIEAVSVKHPSINLMNVWDYTMYQFMKIYSRIEQIDNRDNVMRGLYSGCIEAKGIDLKDYHWAKALA